MARVTSSSARESALTAMVRAIVSGDERKATRLLDASPGLAQEAVEIGASGLFAVEIYFEEIEHYVYGGDTALHVAAAAYQKRIALALIRKDADVRARNRRGAEPLHYAVDGMPGSPTWNARAQKAVVVCLLAAGADPNASDMSGVTPLHRGVRTRCSAAVAALLAGGADPLRRNGNGSTALHLAVRTTGRGDAGSAAAREQQAEIITLLLAHGACRTDRDGAGKSVEESATADWITALLDGPQRR